MGVGRPECASGVLFFKDRPTTPPLLSFILVVGRSGIAQAIDAPTEKACCRRQIEWGQSKKLDELYRSRHFRFMPRSPRIEFEGAIYHVMARGNRREPIVFGDDDRELFVETFSEACRKSSWEVFAWVLMDNHYHAVFRTPEPNLVKGMGWLQNAYTRRLNGRHRLWGHLFGGRYRSILVENKDHGGKLWRDYLTTVIDYVHLNPARAGLVDGRETRAEDYRWSSLATGYNMPPSKRPEWLAVAEVLDLFQERDTAAGRRGFLQRLNSWVREERGDPEVDGVSFADRIQRGWVWGAEDFKESMLSFLEKRLGGRTSKEAGNRTYRSSATMRDRSEKRAELILLAAEGHFGRSRAKLRTPVRGDLTRAAIALRIFEETTMSQGWIAEELGMKSAPNVCQQIRRLRGIDEKSLPKQIKEWKTVPIF